VHVVFVAALFFHLPADQSEPQKEESVQVEIVPPPEEPEKKPDEQKAEEKKPAEEAKPEEKKPPEPAKQEEAKKAEPPPPPPEPPKQEEAKKQEPPPPPPEPPKQEEAKKQEPPPPAPQEQAKQEPPKGEQERQQLPAPRRVFEFGEKDGGLRKSDDGNASQQAAVPTAAEKTDEKPTEAPGFETNEPPVADKPPANPVPDDINAPEIGIASATPTQNGPPSDAAPDATKMAIVTAATVPQPKTEPVKTPPEEKPTELIQAKTLFSQRVTGDPVATTAMAGLPRAFRAGELCSTELEAQLRNASYNVRSWPRPRLPKGTVLDVQNVGFYANNQWYDLSFHCVIDEGATKVVSFALKIGAPVPRSEWRARGFPD
jgi:hypothetical protein